MSKKNKNQKANDVEEINEVFAEIVQETAAEVTTEVAETVVEENVSETVVENTGEENVSTENEVVNEESADVVDNYFSPELSGETEENKPAAPKTSKKDVEVPPDLTNRLLAGYLKKTLAPSVIWNAIYYKYLPENNLDAIRTIARTYPELFAKIGDGTSYKFKKDSNAIINQIKEEMTVTA
jgi:hypothetical protein